MAKRSADDAGMALSGVDDAKHANSEAAGLPAELKSLGACVRCDDADGREDGEHEFANVADALEFGYDYYERSDFAGYVSLYLDDIQCSVLINDGFEHARGIGYDVAADVLIRAVKDQNIAEARDALGEWAFHDATQAQTFPPPGGGETLCI